jgi:hypothetical protein
VPTVVAKKKCCKDTPRCGKCPVTLKRLCDAGYAERESRREFDVAKKIPKKAKVDARTR